MQIGMKYIYIYTFTFYNVHVIYKHDMTGLTFQMGLLGVMPSQSTLDSENGYKSSKISVAWSPCKHTIRD